MASIVKIKRSSVQGKAPTASDLQAGELALNTRDGKLFSSDGSVVFEVGANNTSINVGTLTVGNSSPFTFPTSDGTSGQVLTTNGNGSLSWGDQSSGGGSASNFAHQTYSFTSNGGQAFIGGTDDFGEVLSYEEGNLSVFLNGIRLVANTDYLASNGTSIFLASNTSPNDVVDIETFNSINVINVDAAQVSNTYTSSATSQQVVDSFSASAFRTAKYLVQVENIDTVGEFQVSEVLLVHNGSATFSTEYAEVVTNSRIADINSDLSSGNVRLLVTPTVPNSKIKTTRLAITV